MGVDDAASERVREGGGQNPVEYDNVEERGGQKKNELEDENGDGDGSGIEDDHGLVRLRVRWRRVSARPEGRDRGEEERTASDPRNPSLSSAVRKHCQTRRSSVLENLLRRRHREKRRTPRMMIAIEATAIAPSMRCIFDPARRTSVRATKVQPSM